MKSRKRPSRGKGGSKLSKKYTIVVNTYCNKRWYSYHMCGCESICLVRAPIARQSSRCPHSTCSGDQLGVHRGSQSLWRPEFRSSMSRCWCAGHEVLTMRLRLPVCLSTRSPTTRAIRYRFTASSSTSQPLLFEFSRPCANISTIITVIASTKNSFLSSFVKAPSL